MTAPTEEQLDSLAAALIPTLTRVSDYGFTIPEPVREPKPVLYCAVCGHPLRGHGLGEHPK